MLELLNSPTGQLIIAGLVGALVKAAWDFVAILLRQRGKTDVQRAQMALDNAKLTPDAQDDVMLALALERAKSKAQVLDSLAAALEHSPPPAAAPASAASVLGPPSKGPTPAPPKTEVPNA
jgi:hypothetical protein